MFEFDLIARIRARAATRGDVILGIGDDAALLQPPTGMQLAVAMDTLNAGVHFPPETAAADIGWKALAVNLSDLAAMGAQPAWCTLSLSLPEADAGFVDGFLDGFLALAQQHDVALVGGDTTRGPLSISVTAHGFVEPGTALRRDGAQVGDDIWVSGTLGDARLALAGYRVEQELAPADLLMAGVRMHTPTPRVALGCALAEAGLAHAAIDISDGLVGDLGHILKASQVGATLDVDALPAGPVLARQETSLRRRYTAAGGDDYELCFTASASSREAIAALAASCGTPVTRVGRIEAQSGLRLVDAAGLPLDLALSSFDHFSE